jgi:hypothetical protein
VLAAAYQRLGADDAGGADDTTGAV